MSISKCSTRSALALAQAVGISLFVGVSAMAAPATYEAAVLGDTPYAYYRLGETGGDSALDASGNARHATYVNAPTLGVLGADGDSAVAFNGAANGSYMSLGNVAGFGQNLADFSAEFVLKTQTTATTRLFGVFNPDGQAASQGLAFSISLNTLAAGTASVGSKSTRFYVHSVNDADPAGDRYQAAFTSDAVYSGEYVHLLFAFNANSGLSVYLNGASVELEGALSELNPLTDVWSDFTVSPALGAQNTRGTIGNWSDVTVDEFALYGSALSAIDAQEHYAALQVPEPAAMGLLGLVGLALGRRRR